MADNIRELTTQHGRTAVILIVIYLMVMGLIRIRNESIIESTVFLIKDSGDFDVNDLLYEFQINETIDVHLNITLYYTPIDNRTQAVISFVRWDNTKYNTWEEGVIDMSVDPVDDGLVLEVFPFGETKKINNKTTIFSFTLTHGAWVLQITPQTTTTHPYRVQLTTIP